MHFKYVRIQGQELAENTMYAKGIFSMCWQLIQNDVMDEEDEGLYREIDDWFAENLPWPPQCKNQEKVVCFFKTENADEMMKMIRPALWLLERYNHPYYLVYTNTPGEIVYACLSTSVSGCPRIPGSAPWYGRRPFRSRLL